MRTLAPLKIGRLITKENASAIGKLGGRPKGSFSKEKMTLMKTQEGFAKAIQEKAGLIAEGLLQNLLQGKDTSAGKELLDRAFGKAPQSLHVTSISFSLKDLQDFRNTLKNPPAIVEAVVIDETIQSTSEDI
jgi:hypothetical protein